MTRILSLDDEPEVLPFIGLVLGLAGYGHLCTTNDNKALSILHNEQVDLFTQDVLRPDMDGWEFYQLMKTDENLRSIPVLFISATFSAAGPSAAHIGRLSEYGDDYVTKPCGPRELLTAVTAMMKRHSKHIPTEEERVAGYERLMQKSNWSEEQLNNLYERISSILDELNAST